MENILKEISPAILNIFLLIVGINELLKLPINILKLISYLKKHREGTETKKEN